MPDQDKKKDSLDDESQVAPTDADIKNVKDEIDEAGVPALDSDAGTEPDDSNVADITGDGEDKPVPPDLIPTPDPDEQAKDDAQDTPFDDEKTDRAIDEIIAKEGDDLLAVQDAAAVKGGVAVARKGGGFWRNKWLRSIILLLVLAGLAAALVVPKTRYWALNTAGVRSSSSVVVIDSATQLPLKGVEVSLAGKQVQTDSEGEATFSNLRLGPTRLIVSRVGFKEVNRDVVIGWGSNPFGNVLLQATGVQFVIKVTDYLSQKPVEGVEATDGQATAKSDKNGKVTLTLESAVIPKEGVTLTKAGYRTEAISLNEDAKKPTEVAIVLARKAVFVTKQSGKYDVYKSDLDGKNREVLLAGTGNENSNISLAVSPDGGRVAFASTRENKRDSGGFLLSSLMLINIETGSTVTIAEAAQIQLIDWIGSRLVFQLGSSDNEADDRYAVVSYNFSDNTRVQLASAKKLSAVMSAKGLIYYAVGADIADPSAQVGLFRVGPDGKGSQRVFDEELSTVLRSTYTTLSLQASEGTWYSYDLASGGKTQIGTPTSLANRLYYDNETHTKSLWAGQSALLAFDVTSGKDTTVTTKSGLTYPLQWMAANTVIYRIASGSETADYAVSLDGGTPRKIADVTPTYGFSQAQ